MNTVATPLENRPTQIKIQIPACAQDDARLIFAGEYDIPLNPPPRTVLDIGANVGLFSLWAVQRWPDVEIIAYEPWKENADLFRLNLADYPDVHLRPAAVRKLGFGEAQCCEMMHAGRNELCRSFHTNEGEKLSVTCHAAALLSSAEFVKIDTEGSELEILQDLDLSATRAIALEAHSSADAQAIVSLLMTRGFSVYHRHPTLNGCELIKFLKRTEIRAQKLFIAIPQYGNDATGGLFLQAMMKLQANPPVPCAIKPLPGDSLVPRARNTLTAQFLESDCTDLLFIDSDLLFHAGHIARIMSHDVDLVGGLYPKKDQGPTQWVVNSLPGQMMDERGLQKVRYIGTGFMRIRRNVFEQMIEAYGPKIRYKPDHADRIEYDFWSVGAYHFPDGSERYLSEDWYFCQRWLDLGQPVYGDMRLVIPHCGMAIYPLRTQIEELLRPPAAADQVGGKN